MRPCVLVRALVLVGVVILGRGPAARAQGVPWASPMAFAGYNQYRAYRHFLNSPYSYRTYSTLTPGYAYQSFGPYGYGSVSRGPVYYNQRITPWGFESYQAVPPTWTYWAPYPMPLYGSPYYPPGPFFP